MEGNEFVTLGFEASFQVETDDFIVRKLTVEKDYKEVMSSKESLKQIFRKNDY